MSDAVAEVRLLPPQLADVLERVEGSARDLGVEMYLVGGFVRDRLLGTLGKDIDLVSVDGDGMQVLGAVARAFGWAPPQQFERFGTAQIRGDGFILESVRARAERYDPESRKPTVKPGTLQQDVMRRDFTVNALCQTFDGRVIDITARGLDDLRAGVLRTPLDAAETFAEDPLRMFRAARFRAQLGFDLAPGMLDAMRQQAERASILSVERISEELRRLLISAHPREGMLVLRDSGLLERVMPEVAAMIGVEQGGYHVYDVFDHTMHALDRSPRDLITRCAVLLHDAGKPPTHAVIDGKHTFYDHPRVGADMAREMLTRLRFSNDEADAVSQLVRLHLRPIQYDEATFSDAAVRRLIRDAGDLRTRMLDVARADTEASSYPDTHNIDSLQRRMAALDQGRQLSELRDPLSGDEIMARYRKGPGPWVRDIKNALRDAILDGEIPPSDAPAARRWLDDHPQVGDGCI
ncbi:MAG: HD domain-containing protein [Candidatus Dormibacteraeota bacterium]|nr:HD domain-containing protein [Candidatus Dormibacteraeota bacterium]